MFRRIIILSLCLSLVLSGSIIIFASDTKSENSSEQFELITPYMSYISGTNVTISKNQSGKATIYCYVSGYPGITTKIEITAYLQEYRNGAWQTINTYIQTTNSHIATLSRESTVSSGRSYRVTAMVRAFSGTRSEIQIIRSNELRF